MSDLQILQDLHDSKINGALAWFYDGAWTATLGDLVNDDEIGATLADLPEALEWLRVEAVRRYPDSDFAKRYARGFA